MVHRFIQLTGLLAAILMLGITDAYATAKRFPQGAFALSLIAPGTEGQTVDLGKPIDVIVSFHPPEELLFEARHELILLPYLGEIRAEGGERLEETADSSNFGAIRWSFDPADRLATPSNSISITFIPIGHLGPGIRAQLFLNGTEDNAWIEFATEEPAPAQPADDAMRGLPDGDAALKKLLYAE